MLNGGRQDGSHERYLRSRQERPIAEAANDVIEVMSRPRYQALPVKHASQEALALRMTTIWWQWCQAN